MPCPSCHRPGTDGLCLPCGPHGPFLVSLGQWAMLMESRISALRVRVNATLHPKPPLSSYPKPKAKVLTLDDLDL